MDPTQWSSGFTGTPTLSISPAPRSTSRNSRNSRNSPAPAQPYTMASSSYPPTYGFTDPTVPNQSTPNPHQPSASGSPVPMSTTAHPQSNHTGYLAASSPVMQTPAMGFPTFRYAANPGIKDRFGIAGQAESQQQQALQAQYQQHLYQQQQFQQQYEQNQYQKQLYQQYQQQRQQQQYQQQRQQQAQPLHQASALVGTVNQQLLTVPQQQRHQQLQQFSSPIPPPTAANQQQYLQPQLLAAASPNQINSQISQQHNFTSNETSAPAAPAAVSPSTTVFTTAAPVADAPVTDSPAISSPSTGAVPAPTTTTTTAAAQQQQQQQQHHQNQPHHQPTDHINLNPNLMPPPAPLIEPHPLSKSVASLVLLHHPLPQRAVAQLSMTTASSLLRLFADFEYRDLSADHHHQHRPSDVAQLTPTTRAWLAAHLRELNAARRVSAARLCARWQRCVRERCVRVRVAGSRTGGKVEWVPQEGPEVPGGSEWELKMLDWEAREALGRVERLSEEDRRKGRAFVMPLIRPGWEFLQLRQVRGPSAKEWEDFVVDDVGELRRQRESREKEEREREERRVAGEDEDGGSGDDGGGGDDEVRVVGSRVLSDEEMRAVAAQRGARAARQSASTKNVAAASSKPKKASLKSAAQKKTQGRKKSAAAKAKEKSSKRVEFSHVAENAGQTNVTAPIQSAPQVADYPPIYGEAPQSTNQDTSVATADASNTPTAQVSDYPPIYGEVPQNTNQDTSVATAAAASNTPTAQVSDYPPIFADDTTPSGLPDYPPIHATSTASPVVSNHGPTHATDNTTVGESAISPSTQPSPTATGASNAQPPFIGTSIDPPSIGESLGSGTNDATEISSGASGSALLGNQTSADPDSHNGGGGGGDDGNVEAEGTIPPHVDGVSKSNNHGDNDELYDLFKGLGDE
ncbi:glucosyl transferase [Diplodia corticola]|uniref:Glucosyl transferase n=1 Tax=Diplodia corticola TaxID=236234 RepID=A0A1J9RYF7_9PEZI|nr:glucosyl transferase [Diplodia corticola]OJD33383.1 glucosyl transferase [Diplodia corticola]